jgi:hypothetical protein
MAVTIRPPSLPASADPRIRFMPGDPAARRQRTIASRHAKRGQPAWPISLFLLALLVPWVIYVGPMRMSLYRIVLLVTVLPCVGMWVAGKAGRIRIADIALVLYWLLGALSFIGNNGPFVSMQPVGIGFIETFGAYLLARCYIRNADDFYSMVHLLFLIVAVLFPFAILELLTGINILSNLFEAFWPTTTMLLGPDEKRAGLSRVRSVFDHAILFGVIMGNIFALVHLVLGYQKTFFQRGLRSGIVAMTSFCSLSAGPFVALAIQGFLLCWNWVLGRIQSRWKILIGLLSGIVLAIELFAKRSPVEISMTYILYDPMSYWYRVMEWKYAWASIMNYPLFGIGMHEWERGEGMVYASIDCYWLSLAVQRGLPTVCLLLLSFFCIFLGVSFKKGFSDRLNDYRTGFLITMMAYFLVGWTVAFWDHAYVLFLFLMGSGVWMLDVDANERAFPGKGRPRGRQWREQFTA